MTILETKTIHEAAFDAPAPKRVDRITIRHFYDDSPDFSYLTDASRYDGESEKNRAAYVAEDRERLENLHRGLWCYIGIQAVAGVSYSVGNGSRRAETLTSSGLWGIESDSSASYLAEIERDELDDLCRHLRALCGMDFDIKARDFQVFSG